MEDYKFDLRYETAYKTMVEVFQDVKFRCLCINPKMSGGLVKYGLY
jgi:hypothetical protein